MQVRSNSKYSIRRLKIRTQLVQNYGGKCSCCLLTDIDILCFDHIAGGGTKLRDSTCNGSGLLIKYIRDNNIPNNIRLLCHNCNQSAGQNSGVCKHV